MPQTIIENVYANVMLTIDNRKPTRIHSTKGKTTCDVDLFKVKELVDRVFQPTPTELTTY